MIDIHTHVLPHIDDGARDSKTALEMLRMEAEQGVKTVVLSSHYYGKKRSPEQFFEKRTANFERIKSRIPQDIEVRLAAEVHYTGVNMPEDEQICRFAIEGTKYILIEFPFTEAWTFELLDRLSSFIANTGYTPIIAHAERYKEIHKNPALLNELIGMGCLIQVNAGSFLGGREKKLAYAMLKHGFVHCIGSDAHDTKKRAPCMAQAKARFEKLGLGALWDRAQDIMDGILANQAIHVQIGEPIKKVLFWYV